PRLDTSPAGPTLNQTTIDGAFQLFQKSYSTRDTTLYGALLDATFSFVFRDYEQGIDVTWGRDDELRTTYGLFQTAQRLDLIWNNEASHTETDTSANVVRGFNLTITFNPNDIDRVDGYANLTFRRPRGGDPWVIISWRDESNF
ncbi:MAG TPA: hypothetical protein DGH68_11610, partial [Bacteroidetes bacterium]|nr:hypothetical protein [Bacteroidota bacterium]